MIRVIEPTGDFFSLDHDGYVINVCNLENIDPLWHEVIEDIKQNI